MLNKIKKMFRNSKGFTLIELVVCICILVILMAIAVPKLAGMKDQAKIAADNVSIRNMNNAILLHTSVNGFDNLVGQTSMNVTSPVKNGDSVTVILQFLKDKGGLMEDRAVIYFPQGHAYSSIDNRVN